MKRLQDGVRQLAVLVRMDFASRRILRSNGILHLVIVPMAQLAVFALVFVGIFKARVPGLGSDGYVAFLALGMWPWFAFSEAVGRGATALIDNAGLCTKAKVSPFLLILARVISAFLVHGGGLIVVLLALWLLGPELRWPGLPAYWAGWLALLPAAVALATVSAIVVVFARDFQQVLPLALTVVMFVSPILYSAEMQPAAARALQWLNPPGLAIAAARDAMIWQAAWTPLALSLLGSGLLLAVAYAMYRRLKDVLVDYL